MEGTKSSKENALIEIRAGTGGEEAGLFALDLYNMYVKYADSVNWDVKVISQNPITFELKGEGAYSKMKYEGGVHRVQRIPKTEKYGRIHTSTATVAVLKKPSGQEIKIRPEDIEVDFFRSSGPGGQNVNKRETAVRITHKPSGLVVACQTERSQVQNKENALKLLEARLIEKQEEGNLEQLTEERREQIKWAKRAEKIRTYNFPQNRLTDHRIKKSWHNLDAIIEGKLEPVFNKLSLKS